MVTDIAIWIIQLLLVPVASPLCIGVIRKIKAKLQNRNGAGVWQPYKDIWKLLHKDEVISKDASWIFICAPYLVFAVTLIVGTSIPLFLLSANSFTADLLLVIYGLSIGTFFLALAGIDAGSPFGGFGASREMTMASLAEGGFIFSLLTVALINGTTNLLAIVGNETTMQTQYFLPTALSFFAFFIVMLAETSRFPFDNPATHLELTMIHEAMILEYSGKKLALMEWAATNKLFIFMSLAANLFFPWGIAQQLTVGAITMGVIFFAIKIGTLCLVIAAIESVIAKFRFFRLPDLLVISFILNLVAIGLIYQW